MLASGLRARVVISVCVRQRRPASHAGCVGGCDQAHAARHRAKSTCAIGCRDIARAALRIVGNRARSPARLAACFRMKAHTIYRERLPRAGRSPPSLLIRPLTRQRREFRRYLIQFALAATPSSSPERTSQLRHESNRHENRNTHAGARLYATQHGPGFLPFVAVDVADVRGRSPTSTPTPGSRPIPIPTSSRCRTPSNFPLSRSNSARSLTSCMSTASSRPT